MTIVVFPNRGFKLGLGARCFHASDSFDEMTERFPEF